MKQSTINTLKRAITIWGWMHYGLSVLSLLAHAPFGICMALIGLGFLWTVIGSPGITFLEWLFRVRPLQQQEIRGSTKQ